MPILLESIGPSFYQWNLRILFSVFIAWLNLDFGIETCLYYGLDAYSKTWLQFVFPVYIWVIVGLIIFVSHYSQMFANLATQFLC